MALFQEVVDLLVKGITLPAKYRNHSLTGNYQGWMECHIQPDWLLIWKYEEGGACALLIVDGIPCGSIRQESKMTRDITSVRRRGVEHPLGRRHDRTRDSKPLWHEAAGYRRW